MGVSFEANKLGFLQLRFRDLWPIWIISLGVFLLWRALRPPQPPQWFPLSLDVYDVLANIAGFVPVGIVLAAIGPLRAVTVAALLSLLAEVSQLVMLYRSPSLIDVATNVLGAILGVLVVVRYDLKPEFTATRWIGTGAAALSALLILGTWMMFDMGQRLGGPVMAVMAALASSHMNRPIPPRAILFGEVGLAGEVRAVSRPELRVKEAARLGFSRCLLPQGNLKNLDAPPGMELIGVRSAAEALEGLFE